MSFEIIALLVLFVAAVGLWFLIPIPYLTPKPVIKEILKKLELKTGDKFYELGAGTGRVMVLAAKSNPGIEIIGFEKSLIFYCLAWLNLKLNGVKNAKFYLGNFFKADLRQADAVFCYLFPAILENLKDKFLKEPKPGTKIVSFGFEIKGWLIYNKEVYKNKFTVYFYKNIHH